MSNLQWRTCCRGRKSCPQVALTKNQTIRLRDDYGNEGELDESEFWNLCSVAANYNTDEIGVHLADGTKLVLTADQIEDLKATVNELLKP